MKNYNLLIVKIIKLLRTTPKRINTIFAIHLQ